MSSPALQPPLRTPERPQKAAKIGLEVLLPGRASGGLL